MHRVVVTGMGIISPIGNNTDEVLSSLRDGRSGLEFLPEYRDKGLKSQVAGTVKIEPKQLIDKKHYRFMGEGIAYNYLAMQQAIANASLAAADYEANPRVGLIMGSGGLSTSSLRTAIDKHRARNSAKAIGPFVVPKVMASAHSANIATDFRIHGYNYSVASACSTSAHCIGNGMELIQANKQDIVFCGGGEELDWTLSALFDAMGALSSNFNDTPQRASRPYDIDRDGFVIAGGAGVLVLESMAHAEARKAPILAELVGYGATSDGHDMVQPSGEGAERCMRMALAEFARLRSSNSVSYINTHGTSTPVGDVPEIKAIQQVFGDTVPKISSTKSLTGHSLGGAGVHEAIYSLLMLEHDFIAASANIDQLDSQFAEVPVVRKRIDNPGLTATMSNSFGFGGTNAVLIFSK